MARQEQIAERAASAIAAHHSRKRQGLAGAWHSFRCLLYFLTRGGSAASKERLDPQLWKALGAQSSQFPALPGQLLSAEDRLRHQELQELLSSWQELIWGPSPAPSAVACCGWEKELAWRPGSGALVANAGAAALVTAHLQAVGLVEDGWTDGQGRKP